MKGPFLTHTPSASDFQLPSLLPVDAPFQYSFAPFQELHFHFQFNMINPIICPHFPTPKTIQNTHFHYISSKLKEQNLLSTTSMPQNNGTPSIQQNFIQYSISPQIQQTNMLLKLAYKMSFTYPCPRKLREVMKMSMIEREPTNRIADIWKEYHNPRINNTCAILPKEHYQHFVNRAGSAPLFMIPVFRKGGHFKLITQWQKDCFLGTYMQDYKRKGSNAQPYVVFTFFTELLFNKGIVLVRGDVLNNSMSKPQAEKAWELLQASYCRENNFDLVHNFNNNTQKFNMKAYDEMYGTST